MRKIYVGLKDKTIVLQKNIWLNNFKKMISKFGRDL